MLSRSGAAPLKILAAAALILFSAACAQKPPERPAAAPVERCPVVYVLAPGNYIVNLAAGERVRLDPAWREFELYCSLEEAGAALMRIGTDGRGDPAQWRVYSLAGDYADLAKREGARRVLAAPALLESWETWPPQTVAQ